MIFNKNNINQLILYIYILQALKLMQNKEIRKRIEELKSQSQRLKEISKENGNEQEIVQILTETKKFSVDHLAQRNSNLFLQIPTNPDIILNYNKINNKVRQPDSSSYFTVQRTETKFKQEIPKMETRSRAGPIYSEQSYKQKLQLQQQIVSIRQQNLRLQKLARKYKEQLQLLRSNSQKRVVNTSFSESTNTTPYYKFEQQISIFTTKIKIKYEDYGKIDFTNCLVELNRNIVRLLKDENKVWKEFYLETIKGAFYEQNLIVLEFDSQGETQYLFLLFGDLENLHKWDLGMYINRELRNNLKKQRLFEDEFSKKKEEYSYDPSSYLDLPTNNNSNKQIQEKIIPPLDMKRVSEEKKKMQSPKVQKKLDLKKSDSKTQFQFQQPQIQIIYEDQNEQRVSDVNLKKKISNNQKFIISQNSKMNDILPKDNKKQKTFENSFTSEQIQSKQDINIKKKLDYDNNKDLADYPSNTVLSLSNDIYQIREKELAEEKKNRNLKIQTTLSNLKDGYSFTKYSTGGWKPHLKRVFINQKENLLCWEDSETKKIGSIKLDDINEVEIGKMGPGMIKQDKNLDEKNCLLIKAQTRSLQLSSSSRITVQKFMDELIFLLNAIMRKNIK